MAKLTQKQIEKYIAGGGNHCPFCNSQDIEGHFVEIDSRGAAQLVSCNACGERWTDIYSLVRIETENSQ